MIASQVLSFFFSFVFVIASQVLSLLTVLVVLENKVQILTSVDRAIIFFQGKSSMPFMSSSSTESWAWGGDRWTRLAALLAALLAAVLAAVLAALLAALLAAFTTVLQVLAALLAALLAAFTSALRYRGGRMQ